MRKSPCPALAPKPSVAATAPAQGTGNSDRSGTTLLELQQLGCAETQNWGISQLLEGWKANPLPCPPSTRALQGDQALSVDGLEPGVCSDTIILQRGAEGSRSCLAARTYPCCDHDDEGKEAGTHHVPHPSAVQLQGHGN